MLSNLFSVLIRSPPRTSGYSRPSSLLTFSIAARIAAAFSSLVKSVSGSLRNSVGMIGSVGTHASGVPSLSKCHPGARRRRAYPALRRPFAGFLQFLNLAFDNLPFERRHAIEKDDSVAVIRLVQHAARRQFSSVQFKFFSVNIVRPHNCSQVSFDAKEDARKRKTAFVAILLAFLGYDFRIDHDNALRRIFAAGTIHHEQALRHADLDSRESDARRRVHSFEHVIDELFQVAIKFGDGIRRGLENRIRPGNKL